MDGAEHFVSASCKGEYCGMCYRAFGSKIPATHKVGEEVPSDLPRIVHNLTQYVCCFHFGSIFSPESVRTFRCCVVPLGIPGSEFSTR